MNEEQTLIYEFGDFRIDAAKRLLLKRDGERIRLTPKAFDTLLYLVQHSGTLLEKDELLLALWADTVVEENNLTQHISTLRHVLGEKRDGHRYIGTVPGRGYRFVADFSAHTGVDQPEKVEEDQHETGILCIADTRAKAGSGEHSPPPAVFPLERSLFSFASTQNSQSVENRNAWNKRKILYREVEMKFTKSI